MSQASENNAWVHVEPLEWHSVDTPPDEDTTVLLYAPTASEPVWPGYICDGIWHSVDGFRILNDATHWSNLPRGPVPTE